MENNITSETEKYISEHYLEDHYSASTWTFICDKVRSAIAQKHAADDMETNGKEIETSVDATTQFAESIRILNGNLRRWQSEEIVAARPDMDQ